MANQTAPTASTWVYAYPLPSWIKSTSAGSRTKAIERAAMIEALGDVIPSQLSCSKCRSKDWACTVILTQKNLRCSRCTNSNTPCSLKNPEEKQSIETHFELVKRAVQEGAGEPALEEPEEEVAHEVEVEEEEFDQEVGTEENGREDSESGPEDEEEEEKVNQLVEVEEDEREYSEPNLQDDEAVMDEDERRYYEQQNLIRESVIRCLRRNGHGEEVFINAQNSPIQPYKRD